MCSVEHMITSPIPFHYISHTGWQVYTVNIFFAIRYLSKWKHTFFPLDGTSCTFYQEWNILKSGFKFFQHFNIKRNGCLTMLFLTCFFVLAISIESVQIFYFTLLNWYYKIVIVVYQIRSWPSFFKNQTSRKIVSI